MLHLYTKLRSFTCTLGGDRSDYPPDAVSVAGLVHTHAKDTTGLGGPNSLKLLLNNNTFSYFVQVPHFFEFLVQNHCMSFSFLFVNMFSLCLPPRISVFCALFLRTIRLQTCFLGSRCSQIPIGIKFFTAKQFSKTKKKLVDAAASKM